MISDDEKYQNIISQIHELNRQNLLNENQKIEDISKKIEKIEESSLHNKMMLIPSKIVIVAIIILLINIILTIYLVFKINSFSNNEVVISKEEPIMKEEVILKEDILPESNEEENISEELTVFDKSSVEKFKDEEFEKINPIIRKGTIYTCDEDFEKYKIPYTVEIKGRLYSNRFTFTLQENEETKNCTIKKENM